jgi:hypothetical protein
MKERTAGLSYGPRPVRPGIFSMYVIARSRAAMHKLIRIPSSGGAAAAGQQLAAGEMQRRD